jgi:hypothetical protein
VPIIGVIECNLSQYWEQPNFVGLFGEIDRESARYDVISLVPNNRPQLTGQVAMRK